MRTQSHQRGWRDAHENVETPVRMERRPRERRAASEDGETTPSNDKHWRCPNADGESLTVRNNDGTGGGVDGYCVGRGWGDMECISLA